MLRKAIKNTSLLSLGTFISMFLGFIRDILVAIFFGTSAILEAFIVAFRIPNLLRSIFAEGFADSVATPVLSEYQKEKPKLFKIGRNVLSLSAILLFLSTILGIIFAKFLVILVAPGFIKDVFKFNMAVSFTRVTFLYLFFIGLSVNSFSILYSLRKFFIPSITPAFLNIAFIVGLLFLGRLFKNYILVLCVLSGGLLQVIFPLISLRKEGFIFKFEFRNIFKDKVLIRMIKLFPPRILSSIVYQLSVIVDTIFASFTSIVGRGSLAALWFANGYIHLPLALFAHSISKVAIVDLSYYHSRNNLDDFKKLFVFSFQNIIFFIVPISIIYMFLSYGIIDVILRHGDFDLNSLKITSSVLFCYSLGLFFFCAIKLLVNTFYALKDTLTPAKVTAFSLLINAVLSAILMFPLEIRGVALGSSLAAMFNSFLLYRCLLKRIGRIDWQDTKSQFLKVFLLSLIVGIISRFSWGILTFNKYTKALLIGGTSILIFITGGYIIGLKQIRYIKKWILERK